MLLSVLDSEFAAIDHRSRVLLERLNDENVFQPIRGVERTSCGELIVRSAAMVEQTFGGLTTRLWDDPFEWTLPEKLRGIEGIIEYLNEVTTTRIKGFQLFASDEDLNRELPAPVKIISVFELLTKTLARANHYQGRAFLSFQLLTGKKPPRV